MKWLNTYSLLRTMTARLRWTPEMLNRYRDERLRELVRHTYQHSIFYRRFYDQAGVHPDQIRSTDDLGMLPILSKEMVQSADPMQVVTLPPDTHWMIEITSGSTGRPLSIYRTWRDLYYIKAKVIRAFRQTGLRYYHRQAVLKSSTESVTGRHWFENLGILRKYWLSVTDSPEHNLNELRRIRPQHLHGYPSGLAAIAQRLLDNGEILRLPVICTGAEVLDEVTRCLIERAFHAQVFDFYGSREVGNIAWECPVHDGLHVNDDAIILELVDDRGAPVPEGAEGRVVVTWLDGRDWPFLRYDLGDRAIRSLKGSCPCGVTFSRLTRLEGRSDSRIYLPSGQWISGLVFQELRTVAWVAAFRIVQNEYRTIKLQVVQRREPVPEEIRELIAKTERLVRRELDVIFEIVPQLEPEASGKIRAVICRLPEAQNRIPGEVI